MLLSGKKVFEDFKEKNKHRKPKGNLLIIDIGEDPASLSYTKQQMKLCNEFGIKCNNLVFKSDIEESDLLYRLNNPMWCNCIKSNISKIIIHEPLPKHLKNIPSNIMDSIDVEGCNSKNIMKLYNNKQVDYAPSTAQGIMYLLDYYNIGVEGKNVLIINRSTVIGKPLALMMLNKNATVTIAHSYTKNLKELCQRADIVVTAIGQANYFTHDWFNENAVVIDASINIDENGKMCGDVVKDDYDKINMITPVPGGVGICTNIAMINKLLD